MAAITSFRHSAVYMNKLCSIANQKAGLQRIVGAEKYGAALVSRRAVDIESVYRYIEGSARVGAVCAFNWEWAMPKNVRDLIFNDTEIKHYLQCNGFSYENNNCIHWYGAHDRSQELK